MPQQWRLPCGRVAGDGIVRSGPRYPHARLAIAVDAAGIDGGIDRLGDRNGLARHRRFVDLGAALDDRAVRGNAVASQRLDPVLDGRSRRALLVDNQRQRSPMEAHLHGTDARQTIDRRFDLRRAGAAIHALDPQFQDRARGHCPNLDKPDATNHMLPVAIAGSMIPPVVLPIVKGSPSTRVLGCCVVAGQGGACFLEYLVRLQTNINISEICTMSSRFSSARRSC